MGIDPSQVSAAIVTRGDVDIQLILDSLPFDDVVVWDNSVQRDRKCYGRFLAAAKAKNQVVYTQDDDCLVPVAGLLRAYDPAGPMLVNVPDDEAPLTAWGAIFHKDTINVLDWYLQHYPEDDEFYKTCDVVHTALTPWKRFRPCLGHLDFPWATAPNRMYQQDGHYIERERVAQQARDLDRAAAQAG